MKWNKMEFSLSVLTNFWSESMSGKEPKSTLLYLWKNNSKIPKTNSLIPTNLPPTKRRPNKSTKQEFSIFTAKTKSVKQIKGKKQLEVTQELHMPAITATLIFTWLKPQKNSNKQLCNWTQHWSEQRTNLITNWPSRSGNWMISAKDSRTI